MHGPGNVGRATFVRTAGHGLVLASQGPSCPARRIAAPRLRNRRGAGGAPRNGARGKCCGCATQRRNAATVPLRCPAAACLRAAPARRRPSGTATPGTYVAAAGKVHEAPGTATAALRGRIGAFRPAASRESGPGSGDFMEHRWDADVPRGTGAGAEKSRLTPATAWDQGELWHCCTSCRLMVSNLLVCRRSPVRAGGLPRIPVPVQAAPLRGTALVTDEAAVPQVLHLVGPLLSY